MTEELSSDKGAPIRFAILAEARSGSGWLVGMLTSHPACVCYDELFGPTAVKGGPRLKGVTVLERDATPLGFLERAFAVAAEAGVTHIGFKQLPGYSQAVVEQLLADPRYRIVFLTRRDRLAQYASRRIAEATGRWGAFGTGSLAAPREQPRIRFSARDFIDYCRQAETWFRAERAALGAQGRPVLEITYEELDGGPGLARVLAFLGLPPAELSGRHRRQNDPAVAARFENPRKALLLGPLIARPLPRAVIRRLRHVWPFSRLLA